MKMNERYPIPTDATTAAALLAQESTYAEAARRLGATSHSESVTADGDAFTTSAAMTVPTKGVPAVAAKFVGDTISVKHSEKWSAAEGDGRRTAPMTVVLEGLPIRCEASLTLVPTGDTCELDLVGEITASIPLVGGKLAQAAADPLEEAIETIAAVVGDRASQG
ncbi:MAG: DUF2505 domain-containing protein [Dermatophilus congolensis]|nr:DUF2505 domain-containing protein [Dermatophilus congolensis]